LKELRPWRESPLKLQGLSEPRPTFCRKLGGNPQKFS
jgi:hypothetical protein